MWQVVLNLAYDKHICNIAIIGPWLWADWILILQQSQSFSVDYYAISILPTITDKELLEKGYFAKEMPLPFQTKLFADKSEAIQHNPLNRFNEDDILGNVFLGNVFNIFFVVIMKQQTQLR